MENIKTFLWITCLRSLVYQPIIGWITPASSIVAVPSRPYSQKRGRIHVVADPAAPAHIIIHRILTLGVHFPFLILDADINVKLLLPHLLDRFRDHPVRFVGIDQDIELRKTFAVWVTGFCQQLPGSLRVIMNYIQRLVTIHPRWH